ncbi:DUF882 domain-containing protein [Pantoea ananatis]
MPIKPKVSDHLFDQLYRLQALLETRKPVQLVSGYRSPATNNMLRESRPAWQNTVITPKARRCDFHIEGHGAGESRKAALKMRAGGVGYYPSSNLIHIDTGSRQVLVVTS